MMKKVVLSTLIAVLLISTLFGSASFAYSYSSKSYNTLEDDFVNTFNYNINGVEIESNVMLSRKDLENLYYGTINQTNNFTINAEDPGSSYVRETPPYYRVARHTLLNEAIDAVAAYLLRYVRPGAWGNWVGIKVTQFTNFVKPNPAYIGSWVSSSYSNYYKERRYYATVIHYKKSNFTQPRSIQYYDATHLYKK